MPFIRILSSILVVLGAQRSNVSSFSMLSCRRIILSSSDFLPPVGLSKDLRRILVNRRFCHHRQFCTTLFSKHSNSIRDSDTASHHYSVITSPKSQTVKKIQALLSKRKKRFEFGQTIVEGPRMVFDLLDNDKTFSLIRQIVVSLPEYEQRQDYRSKLDKLDQHDKGLLVQLANPDVFAACTDTVTPQGIVAIVDVPNYLYGFDDFKPTLDATYHSEANPPFYLVLDGVSDPGNLGTLVRSSLAVGVASILLLPGCCDVWNPKAVRSAMGASFQIPIQTCDSWQDGWRTLQQLKVQTIYAATMIDNDPLEENDRGSHEKDESPSIPYFQVDWTENSTALIIGSEGNGLSSDVRSALVTSDSYPYSLDHAGILRATHIPMGAGIESLNAAICGSVILFEYYRQHLMKPSTVVSNPLVQ